MKKKTAAPKTEFPQIEPPAPEAAPPVAMPVDTEPMRTVHQFTRGAVTYVYDFDELTLEQVMMAEAVFTFHNQQLQQMPRNLRELALSGRAEHLAVAMSYLLRRKISGDDEPLELEPFSANKGREAAETFIRLLPAKQWNRLQECKADFFSRANIVDGELLMQFGPLIELAGQAQSQGLTQTRNGSEKSEQNTKSNNVSLLPGNRNEE